MTARPELATRWSRIPEAQLKELETYESELQRFLDGKANDKVFLEFRLRHGVYGQRQAGIQMQRIKIPLGMLTLRGLEVLAELAEEYSDGICHVTTRQDIQLHFVDIRDTPVIFRRLAEAGITTREACGNTVRNVTACPNSGVCPDEVFDVTPYARAMAYFLLRHPDAQSFGRKFKIAFSGCAQHACGLAFMHDIGMIARERTVDGQVRRGFEMYVGGGLGAIPHRARLFDEFLPPEEMLPIAQAIARVFARLGEKKSRSQARMKFLVAKMGIDEFRRTVLEERGRLPQDPRWKDDLSEVEGFREEPLKPPSALDLGSGDLSGEFRAWHRTNVMPQKQKGYSMVTVFLPLGDGTSDQLLELARIAKNYLGDTIRTTVEQNLLLRWVSDADLPALHRDLKRVGLALPGAGGIADITACPGTDSCKLGIASSRGLAGVLMQEYAGNGNGDGRNGEMDGLRIKISGCPNSCGQHHIADIGFFGSSKRKGSHVVPVFQVVLGGHAGGNANAFGMPVAKVAACRAPDVVRKLRKLYEEGRKDGETFGVFADRLGKARLNGELAEFGEIPEPEQGPEYYQDNRQPWQYVKFTEAGECAGEVVEQAEFMLEDADRMAFEASLDFEAGRIRAAAEGSLKAMKTAADGILSTQGLLLSDRYDTEKEFRTRFFEAGKFFPGFAEYFFRASAEDLAAVDADRARQRVEEATLFIEEAHVVYSRMAGKATK
jgi:sulfite reductase (ferredoxin)